MNAPGLSEIVATTLRNRAGKLADNVTNNNALLNRLRKRGNIRTFSGGRSIVEELAYQENQTPMWYSGYEPLDVRPSELFSAAEFSIKQAAVSVSMSGLEQLQNAGREQVINLMNSRIQYAEKTFMNFMSTAIYSDGTADNGKQLAGLQSLVSDTGLDTVGGINSSTWGFWQNAIFDFSANGLSPGVTTIQTAMNNLYLSLIRNTDYPQLIVTDNTFYLHYLESLQPNMRHADKEMADAGFKTLQYMGVPVVLDGAQGGSAPASHMYMLNLDYLFFRPHSKRNIVSLGDRRQPINQDAWVQFLAFAGNMTICNRSLQGVIVA